MKMLIKLPDEFDEEHQNELVTLFKLLCDNIDTNGIEFYTYIKTFDDEKDANNYVKFRGG